MQIDLAAIKNRVSARSAAAISWRAYLFEEYEYQVRQGFLFLPICLALGIGAYFALPVEPPLALGGFAVVCSFFIAALLRPRFSGLPTILFLITLGFLAGQVRSHLIYTPILQRDVGPAMVSGEIDSLEDLGKDAGARIVLSSVNIEGFEPVQTPRKVRLKVRNDDGLYVGQRIEALSKLHPPSPPLMPGGFDFQRYLYFQGIGGVGFVYKDVTVLEDVSLHSFMQSVESLRQNIGQRIEAAMHDPASGVAMALVIGRKSAIEEGDKEAMRAAGLAHMLAISGLHVGLFSGALFFVVRFFMALIPGLALRLPIKKYAAVIAMAGALGYMFIAGASIPTQRAMLMTGIVLLAIILDRSPISLRLVAFAAFVVLLFFPESLLSASFHMSFAAVTGLVAFYDWLRPHWSAWHSQAGVFRRAGLYFLGVSFTTVIATFATAPFALFHFQQLAVYSMLANLVAVPLLGFVIMPSVLLALVLMPFGLEFAPLYVTEQGTRAVLDIAHWVAALPHAVLRLPVWPEFALVLIVLAGLGLVLMRGYGRWLAVVPLCLSLAVISGVRLPNVLIGQDGKLVAARGDDGVLYVSDMRAERFTRESWTQSYGLEDSKIIKWAKEGETGPVFCGEMACRITIGGQVVSYVRDETAAPVECQSSDAVFARFPLRKLCGYDSKARTIDIYDIKKNGAYALWVDGDGVKVSNAAAKRGARLWSSRNLKVSDKSASN